MQKRLLHYDYLRVAAMVCIVGIHALGAVETKTVGFGLQWWYGHTLGLVAGIGLPIFFMVSGALLLHNQKDTLKEFYLKRVFRIVIPLFVYSLIYLFVFNYNYSLSFFGIHAVIRSILQIIEAPVYAHLWFVYTIIGLYVTAPFVKVMLQNLSDKMVFNLVMAIIILRIIATYLPILGINVQISTWISEGWMLFFILGYALTREGVQKMYKTIYLLGLVSFGFSLAILRFAPATAQVALDDLSPTMICMASAAFCVFMQHKEAMNTKHYGAKLVSFLAKYSYSVFLIHLFVLIIVVNKAWKIDSMTVNYFIGFPLTVGLTIAVSLFLAVVIDTIVVNPIMALVSLPLRQRKLE